MRISVFGRNRVAGFRCSNQRKFKAKYFYGCRCIYFSKPIIFIAPHWFHYVARRYKIFLFLFFVTFQNISTHIFTRGRVKGFGKRISVVWYLDFHLKNTVFCIIIWRSLFQGPMSKCLPAWFTEQKIYLREFLDLYGFVSVSIVRNLFQGVTERELLRRRLNVALLSHRPTLNQQLNNYEWVL